MSEYLSYVHDTEQTWLVHKGFSPKSCCGVNPIPRHPLSAAALEHSTAIRAIGYFEVELIGGGSVGLGSVQQHSGKNNHVGWRKYSYGYHSDDGSKWRSDDVHGQSNGMDGEPYAAPYGASCPVTPRGKKGPSNISGRLGDVIGCGIDFGTKEIFFTLNGEMQGVAFKEVEWSKQGWSEEEILHPTLTLHNEPSRARVNLGGEAFVFDLAPYLLKATEIPAPVPGAAHAVNQADAGDAHLLEGMTLQDILEMEMEMEMEMEPGEMNEFLEELNDYESIDHDDY